MKSATALPPWLTDRMASLRDLFGRRPAVLSAYLFGSLVQGLDHPDSDADVAVRVEDRLGPVERHELRGQLIEDLEALFDRRADVVILNDASLEMIHQVHVHGLALFVRDWLDEESYMLRCQKEYFDFQHYLEKDRSELRRYFDS